MGNSDKTPGAKKSDPVPNHENFERFMPKKTDSELEQQIAELVRSGSYKEAHKKCLDAGIDPSQFYAFINPGSPVNVEIKETPELPNYSHSIKKNHASKTNAPKEIMPSNVNPRPLNSNIHSSKRISPYVDNPYTVSELIKITKPAHYVSYPEPLLKITSGLLNSYVSKEMLLAFNMADFLAQMSEFSALKNERVYLGKLRMRLNDTLSPQEGYEEVIRLLKTKAYTQGNWGTYTAKLRKGFADSRNEERLRVNSIPQEHKERFLETLLSREPIVMAEKYGYFNNIKDLKSQKKIGYARFIEEHMSDIWNSEAYSPTSTRK